MWGPLARANGAWEVPFFVQCFFVQHGWNGVCYSLGCKAKTKPYQMEDQGLF